MQGLIKYPLNTLTGTAIKTVIRDRLVSLVNARGDRAHAIRVIWRVDDDRLEHAWDDVVSQRHLCDQIVAQTPSLQMFVSCICGVFNKVGAWRGKSKPVYPAVSYWLVLDGEQVSGSNNLIRRLLEACPSTQVKPILSMVRRDAPVEPTAMCGPLFVVLKDHNSGFVHRKIRRSLSAAGNAGTHPHPRNAKLAVVSFSKYDQDISAAVEALNTAGLCIDLEVFGDE